MEGLAPAVDLAAREIIGIGPVDGACRPSSEPWVKLQPP